MSNLEGFTEAQLEKMIAVKEKQQAESKKHDYSQQYKRGMIDPIRDLAYGAVHGPMEFGKMMGNAMTGGNLEKIPGYKQYIPWMEKQINKIQSPNPSPGGDLLKIGGEFLAPEAAGARLVARGASRIAPHIPSLTRGGMERLYTNASRTAAEEGVHGLSYPERLLRQIEEHAANQTPPIPLGDRLERAAEGGYEGGSDLISMLGQLRRGATTGEGRIGAGNLHTDFGRHFMQELERRGYQGTHAARHQANRHYENSARARAALGALARYTPLGWIHALTRHI